MSSEIREFILIGQDKGADYELWDIAPAPTDPVNRAIRLEEIGVDAMDALGGVTTVWATDEDAAIEKFRREQAEISGLDDFRVIRHGQEAVTTVSTATAAGGVLYGIEAEVQRGVPSFTIEGAGRWSHEVRDRVRAGISNAGLPWPLARVTVRLTPAGEPAQARTSTLDFSIAFAVLAASGHLPDECLDGVALVGELGLDGSLRPVRGMTANAAVLAEHGHRTLMVPGSVRLRDADLPPGVLAVHVHGLNEALADLTGHVHHPMDCLHCGRGDRPHGPCTYDLPCRTCRDDGMEPVGA
ncbi:hypothetical protein E0L36_22000 [Streptomyces sp. AJS327]|uniref:magnesium chelatase domain-containing protein n=1 Tax=Streptomyces sp. AJS327 TaxID=2545265 RepID=UPI0015DEBB14|nr:magnesium chelatase domain-containing protein [Streptomyces sp. AJS327]MBA0053450.1 hypothetical protein [Streptomyces sp. AJS327]